MNFHEFLSSSGVIGGIIFILWIIVCGYALERFFFFRKVKEKKRIFLFKRVICRLKNSQAKNIDRAVYDVYKSPLYRQGFFVFAMNSAPTLGLLGTILGLIYGFSALKGKNDITIFSCLAHALTSTLFGSIVALAAMTFNFWSNNSSKKIHEEIERLYQENPKIIPEKTGKKTTEPILVVPPSISSKNFDTTRKKKKLFPIPQTSKQIPGKKIPDCVQKSVQ